MLIDMRPQIIRGICRLDMRIEYPTQNGKKTIEKSINLEML